MPDPADGAALRALEDGAFERELRSSGATLLEEATVCEVDVGEREAAAPSLSASELLASA